jgi:formylmethanofuran dehydrogenase subunit C
MTTQHDIERIFAADASDQRWRTMLYDLLENQDTVELSMSSALDCLFPAMRRGGRLLIHGNAGDYAFAYNEFTDISLDGNVGDAAGLGIRSGVIHVYGGAGDYVATQGQGGTVIVNRNTGHRCGAGLNGADLCVLGSVGNEAGFAMTSGAMVIQGDAGEQFGANVTGGVIYLRGQAKSVAPGISDRRMKEPDRFRLSLILARANITANAKDFRVYKPESVQ